MRKLLATIVVTNLLIISYVRAEDSYICVADLATGFIYKNNQWKVTEFKVDEKYIISKPTVKDRHYPNAIYLVKEIGKEWPVTGCGNFTDSGLLFCGSVHGLTFKMSRNTLRYIYAITHGYWIGREGTETDRDSPYIEIGKCSPM